jgi:hypothetical protein
MRNPKTPKSIGITARERKREGYIMANGGVSEKQTKCGRWIDDDVGFSVAVGRFK